MHQEEGRHVQCVCFILCPHVSHFYTVILRPNMHAYNRKAGAYIKVEMVFTATIFQWKEET